MLFILAGLTISMYLLISTYWDIRKAAETNILSVSLSIKMSLWAFLFGIFLEWRGLSNLFQRHVKINWLIAPAIILTALSFIPTFKWVDWLGIGNPFYIEMFYIPEIHNLLDVASGILLIRSLSK